MSIIYDFDWYSRQNLKIRTKVNGVTSFKLRKYQLRYLDHLKNDFPSGIIRSIVVKPRQSGFSTLIAGINVHKMCTNYNEVGILLADKYSRTGDVHGIYSLMVNNLPLQVKPMVDKINGDEIMFDNPNKEERIKKPGLISGIKSETANDPWAGRAGTRRFAHMTEFAFYNYATEVDEGIQNSIPLAKGTRIFKESTSNGMAGSGEAFYVQYKAAAAGESIYKHFFVNWAEIDDYQMEAPRGFILNSEEIDIMKRFPDVTLENMVWRRMKLSEYSQSSESPFSPQERFKADFPLSAEESFLSTGRPVFDADRIRDAIEDKRRNPVNPIKISIEQRFLKMFPELLTIFSTPAKGKKYFIGADVSLGLDIGDASSAVILDDDLRQVASFHGKIDPDLFGKCLVELARVYNGALIVPEVNAMGHTTLNAIKEMGYLKVYMRSIQDEIEESKETSKMGWVTTSKSKQKMLNKLITAYRDDDIKILDIKLLMDMASVVRENNGDVTLNSKDRTVACCLALMGADQGYEPARVFIPGKQQKIHFEAMDKSREMVLKKKI